MALGRKLKHPKTNDYIQFEIPINVFGKRLSIENFVVNGHTRISENCRIHTCVNIGTAPGANGLASTIGNDVMIGANACVGKDLPDNVCQQRILS